MTAHNDLAVVAWALGAMATTILTAFVAVPWMVS